MTPGGRRQFPVVTFAVLTLTALITLLQFFHPAVLPELRRTPAAISSLALWRLITPLFVHADGWKQIVLNFTGIAIVGSIVERLYGPQLWLLLYFGAGIVGELIALAWQPYGAGASLAGAGLLGGLAMWMASRKGNFRARCGGGIIALFAIGLTAFRDIHGLPILLGMCLSIPRNWRPTSNRNDHG